MDEQLQWIDYAQTGYFSPLILDFLNEDPRLQPFSAYSSAHPDFAKAMNARRAFSTDRRLLVETLQQQYAGLNADAAVLENITALKEADTFTVCTAHQPNLFTGYLYFVYKVLQTVKLAAQLKQQYPDCHFVPVYYMGSEDNDLEELGAVKLDGKQLRWETPQQGAVGRMKPEGIDELIEAAARLLGMTEAAKEIIGLLQQSYLGQPDIQTATLHLVNALFGRFGLVVLIADTPGFKRAILPVLREELFGQTSHAIVQQTVSRLSEHYHIQAHPREINLFYLGEQLRERIVKEGEHWKVLHTSLRFTQEELEKELERHPERFSPNVILRGILQETVLPGIAFIGGGGELAYWLELKGLFDHYRVPYPPLLLRNSFLCVDEKALQKLAKVKLQPGDLFRDTEQLIAGFVRKYTVHELALKQEYEEVEAFYRTLEKKAAVIDVTLTASVAAERTRALRSVRKLEHKFLRAEKKKFEWQASLIREVKARLFPSGSLQERVENLLPWYARYGPRFLDTVYEALDPLVNKFTIISIGDQS